MVELTEPSRGKDELLCMQDFTILLVDVAIMSTHKFSSFRNIVFAVACDTLFNFEL